MSLEEHSYDSGLPEQDVTRTVLTAAMLGALSEIPMVGGAASAAIQARLAAASRERDEEWFAMLAARIANLEVEGRSRGETIDIESPEFIAAVHRMTRAAQETADHEKRLMLAGALASASISTLEWNERERFIRLVSDLSPLHVRILGFFASPTTYLRVTDLPSSGGTPFDALMLFLGDELDRRQVNDAVEDLVSNLLLGMLPPEMRTPNGMLSPQVTERGDRFLVFLG
ncbi:hypothetical protein [Agromyces sp. NPDC055658]